MNFLTFANRCSDAGLTAAERCETHWQILLGLTPLVDFWPTANKVRLSNAKNKSKAVYGDAEDAIRVATIQASNLTGQAAPPASEALAHYSPEFIGFAGHALCGLAARYGDALKPHEIAGRAFALAEAMVDEFRDACPRPVECELSNGDAEHAPFDPEEMRKASGVRRYC